MEIVPFFTAEAHPFIRRMERSEPPKIHREKRSISNHTRGAHGGQPSPAASPTTHEKRGGHHHGVAKFSRPQSNRRDVSHCCLWQIKRQSSLAAQSTRVMSCMTQKIQAANSMALLDKVSTASRQSIDSQSTKYRLASVRRIKSTSVHSNLEQNKSQIFRRDQWVEIIPNYK